MPQLTEAEAQEQIDKLRRAIIEGKLTAYLMRSSNPNREAKLQKLRELFDEAEQTLDDFESLG